MEMEIMSMSAREIVLIKVLPELAEEAFKAEQIIKEHFDSSFGIGKKEIHVYHMDFNGYSGDLYLTIDGVFKYHNSYNHKRMMYEFSCDADSIYRMLRSCYLKKNNLYEVETEKLCSLIKHLDDCFREFIEKLLEGNNN